MYRQSVNCLLSMDVDVTIACLVSMSLCVYATDYYPCRDDVVRVLPGNNGSLMIQAAQQGEAILRVWLRDHAHIDDYIRVRVGFAITPNMATVHLGTHICFSTHIAEGDHEHE